MSHHTNRKPAITVTRQDHDRLSRLVDRCTNVEVASFLAAELDRARIVDQPRRSRGFVRMGSSVRFSSDLGEERVVTLVFPGNADIAEGKVSILSPIGAALVGLTVGQSIHWTGPDGRVHRLTVTAVEPAQAEDPAIPTAPVTTS
ncbi:nucleoside diphosphate kinase regulator [Rhizobium sp. EC-SD404]|uniref:nucleoside diphosphate kinase regulator n=1 Tax=Rhizobium sp. EC-SD404 TaxID=2038389 RepID=UPI00125FB429|nr:nucleoside diphosphate kinase regulator [Rhizobium sp. EC-SD404]